MVDNRRRGRIETIIREVLTDQLERELRDPRIGFLTLTGVDISSDLSVAKVYYTVLGDEATRADSDKGLKSAMSYLRRKVGEALDLRRAPELRFLYDHSVDRGMAMEELLTELEISPEDDVRSQEEERRRDSNR